MSRDIIRIRQVADENKYPYLLLANEREALLVNCQLNYDPAFDVWKQFCVALP